MEKDVAGAVVKKIVIKIGDKEITLTPAQAKRLKEILNDMFGKEIVKEVIKEEHHYHYDRFYWGPTYQPTMPSIPSYPLVVWCGDTSINYDNNQQSVSCSLYL